LVPFLTFVFVIAVDYGRVFYYSMTVQNSARKGALYGSQDAAHSADTSGIKTAALADATDITEPSDGASSSGPGVSSTTGTDSNGSPTLNVTVTYTMNTITKYPGVPDSVSLSRTVSMRVLP
jgi:Flp pilus assembly protein TadG